MTGWPVIGASIATKKWPRSRSEVEYVGIRSYPEVRAAFPTAAEIAPEWHLRMQAAVQRHVDAAVSKTVNLPAAATVDDVRAIYLAAWKAKVKGIKVYRYDSRE